MELFFKTSIEKGFPGEGDRTTITLWEENKKLSKLVGEWLAGKCDISRQLGQVTLVQYPGCCGINILTGLKVEEKYRRKGYAIKLIQECVRYSDENYTIGRRGMLKATCVGLVMCEILEKMNFVKTAEFINPRTNNRVYEYSLNLND